MKVYSIACVMTGHINVTLVLQSCTDPLHVLPSSSSVTYTSYNINNVKFEEDVDVKEEGFIAIKEELDIGIKQEEIPEDTHFPDIKSEPGEVSYVCVCMSVIRHIFPVSSFVNFLCQYFCHLKQLHP
jgi:hypothetical protein